MRTLNMIVLCAALMIMLTGCGGYFNKVEKNKVMVKKISEEQVTEEISYGDTLSLGTVNTLSINAVNKYFDKKFKEDDVKIDIRVVDQQNLRYLFENVEYGAAPQPEGNKSIVFDTQAMLKEVPSGLFYVDLGSVADFPSQYEYKYEYDLVLSAKDGKVLQIKEQINPQQVGIRQEKQQMNTREVIFTRESIEEVIDNGTRFVKEELGLTTVQPLSGKEMIRWNGSVVELFFKDEQNESVIASVFVDTHTNKIVGFNRGLMAVLSFFSY
ncbi:hypothetical protein I6N90_24350 [Paenibacillus sp. GSMTC-2017]|uniref:hypothetical protein n=1 Tax=Paenibacillus sp. GSMTC-2017 TaxID=2794350 RepID=UPI0018D5D72C|nr:hypothetical protein [Paenibacillus sp. GSMTC-2017]MBH5320921.1 hypothetical protein [Paenibacillus sp. GSMTC-2017]